MLVAVPRVKHARGCLIVSGKTDGLLSLCLLELADVKVRLGEVGSHLDGAADTTVSSS